MLQVEITKGGKGSGNFDHAGIPGHQGGSAAVMHSWMLDYEDINGMLRQGNVTHVTVAQLDSLFKTSSPLERSITVYRGVELDKKDAPYIIDNLSKGYSIRDEGFIATSSSIEYAKRFAEGTGFKKYHILFELSVEAGTKVLDISSDLDEKLLPRHGNIKVTGVRYGKDGIIYVKGDFYTLSNVHKEQVEKQLPISDKSRAKLISVRNEIFKADVAKLAENMYLGTTSLGQWEETMKKMIRELHTSAASIAKGGWENMTPADWGRIGTPMREQYRYLHNFAQHIAENRDEISLKAIQARAAMYGNAAGHTAVLMIAGAEISKLLPWMPRDGSTECLVNCQCRWELKVVDKLKDGMQVVQAVWKLGAAEHCLDCVNRMNHVEIITVSKDTTIPSVIGGF